MANYTGKYFDSKTEGPTVAQISFLPTTLQITYQTISQNVPVTVYWQIHRLEKEIETGTGKTILRYGSYPGQTLVVEQPGFLSAYEAYYVPTPVAPTPAQQIPKPQKRGLGVIYLFFLTLLALIPVGYFWALPAAADLAARKIPMAYEQKLGRMLAAQLIPESSSDSLKSVQLQRFVRQLTFSTPAQVQMIVIRNPIPNAFALPGGTIVVHDAMLKIIQSPAELAGLVGHEYGHVASRHSLRALFRSLSGYFLISAIFGDVSAVFAVILQNAHAFKSLAYSRQFEKEADEMSLDMLRQNNQNPDGLIQLFKHLQHQNPKQTQENEYLSSHPLLSSRIKNIRELIKKKPYQVVNHDSLVYYYQQLKK